MKQRIQVKFKAKIEATMLSSLHGKMYILSKMVCKSDMQSQFFMQAHTRKLEDNKGFHVVAFS
jgi:hypothetical protein